jgi:hypothetical protein
VFSISVNFHESPVFELAHAQNNEEVGSEDVAPTGSREVSPTLWLTLPRDQVTVAIPGGNSNAHDDIGSRKGVFDE